MNLISVLQELAALTLNGKLQTLRNEKFKITMHVLGGEKKIK
jgi:hypothetical protein